MKYENLDYVKRIDFQRLSDLTVERIAVLRMFADNIDKSTDSDEMNDIVCRDLVIPLVQQLAVFIDSVKFSEEEG